MYESLNQVCKILNISLLNVNRILMVFYSYLNYLSFITRNSKHTLLLLKNIVICIGVCNLYI